MREQLKSRIVMPTTLQPASFKTSAATELSTPPDIATAIFCFFFKLAPQIIGP